MKILLIDTTDHAGPAKMVRMNIFPDHLSMKSLAQDTHNCTDFHNNITQAKLSGSTEYEATEQQETVDKIILCYDPSHADTRARLDTRLTEINTSAPDAPIHFFVVTTPGFNRKQALAQPIEAIDHPLLTDKNTAYSRYDQQELSPILTLLMALGKEAAPKTAFFATNNTLSRSASMDSINLTDPDPDPQPINLRHSQ